LITADCLIVSGYKGLMASGGDREREIRDRRFDAAARFPSEILQVGGTLELLPGPGVDR
jgi:hypothetical protein